MNVPFEVICLGILEEQNVAHHKLPKVDIDPDFQPADIASHEEQSLFYLIYIPCDVCTSQGYAQRGCFCKDHRHNREGCCSA